MGVDLPHAGQAGEAGQTAVRPADRDVAHGERRLLRQPDADHLVVGPARSVDEEDVAVAQAVFHLVVHLAHPGQIDQRPPGVRIREPIADGRLAPIVHLAHEIRGRPAGHAERLIANAAGPVVHAYQVMQIVWIAAEVDVLPGTTGRAAHGAKHRVAVHDPAAYLLGRVQGERLGFAQRQQAGDMVHLGIGQQHRMNGAVPRAGLGRQGVEAGDLLADVRPGIDQIPTPVVGADGNGGLGPRRGVQRTRAQSATLRTVAVPLRKPAARPRTQDTNPHIVPLFPLVGAGGIAGTGKKTGFSQKMGKPVKRTPVERSYSETRMYMLTSASILTSVNSGFSHAMRLPPCLVLDTLPDGRGLVQT